MENNRALATLTQLPTTQTEIKSYVQTVKDDILGGWIQPEESAIILKAFEDIVKALRQDQEIKEYILSEAEKYTEKTFDYGGAQLTKSSRTTYDYSRDEEWSELNEQLNDIKAYIKARETLLMRNRDSFPSKTIEILSVKLGK